MPRTSVFFYQESDENCPIINWLDEIPERARDKCVVRLQRLAEMGHELRRPEADLLRGGIHELRVGLNGINYRMLYFFYGRSIAVVAHGLVKERVVPPGEIDLAIRRKQRFEQNPKGHTYEEPSS